MDKKIIDNKELFNSYVQYLINQTWRLIPMRENNENWEDHLNILIEELYGANEIFSEQLNFVVLMAKLEGLKYPSLDFSTYRSAVFKSIKLLSGGKKNE